MKKKVLTKDGVESVEVIDEFSMFGQMFFTYNQREEDSIHVIDAYSGYSVYRIDLIEYFFLNLKELSALITEKAKELLKQKRHEFFELRYSSLLEETGSTNPINADYENAKNNA